MMQRMIGTVMSGIFRPFERFASPWPALVAVSLVLAILALVVFKFSSRQTALRRARSRMLARVLEIRLFQDDLAGIFGAFGRILAANLSYLKETMIPLAVMIVPMALLLIHSAGWFEVRPLRAGESALLTVQFADSVDVRSLDAMAVVSPGLVLETGGFRSPASRQMVWRFRVAEDRSPQWIDIRCGEESVRKQVEVGDRMARVSPRRVAPGGSAWLNPGEPPLPAGSAIRSVEVDFPRRVVAIGAFRVNWILALFVLSLGVGLALRPVLRVEL